MIDSPTKSLWSHLLGQAMRGPLKETRLEVIPSRMTDWSSWRKLHPKTTVVILSRTSKDYSRDFYKYLERFVIGLAEGKSARAWPFDQLQKQPVVNDEIGGLPVLVVYDRQSSTAFVYQRNASQGEHTFEFREGRLLDLATRSVWDLHSGRAISGPLRGTQLKPAQGIVSYRRAWQDFHPESDFWKAK